MPSPVFSWLRAGFTSAAARWKNVAREVGRARGGRVGWLGRGTAGGGGLAGGGLAGAGLAGAGSGATPLGAGLARGR
jgi:hypothetical protein